jgi:hypothetical protein
MLGSEVETKFGILRKIEVINGQTVSTPVMQRLDFPLDVFSFPRTVTELFWIFRQRKIPQIFMKTVQSPVGGKISN